MSPQPRVARPQPTVVDEDDIEHSLERRCCIPTCGAPIHDLSPVEVCRSCGMKIARAFKDDLIHDDIQALVARARHRARADAERPSFVYYILRPDNYVKIGFTTNIAQRLKVMHVDLTCLLAVEPGGREREHERHVEFASERRAPKREEFLLSEALKAHIGRMRAAHEIPVEVRPPYRVRAIHKWSV